MNNFFISWLWERMMFSTGPETHRRYSLNASSHWSCMWSKMPHKTKAKANTVAWRHAISKSGRDLLVPVRWRFRARDMLLFFNTGKLLSLWEYTVVPLYPQYGFYGFSYPQPSVGQKQMNPLLCCHKVSSSLMLYQDASVLLRPYLITGAFYPLTSPPKGKYCPIRYSERDHIQIIFIIICCFNHSIYY